jgi:hypothetical protein
MRAELEGALVAQEVPEGGLHTWPHGRKIFTAKQDQEGLRRRLWITRHMATDLWINDHQDAPAHRRESEAVKERRAREHGWREVER